MYAIWLLFSDNDTSYLEKIITNLNLKYNLPKFIPHITIFGLMNLEKEKISEIIEKNLPEFTSFTVNTSKINYSDDKWRSIFIEIQKNVEITLINNKFNYEFKIFEEKNFFPHISLMYNFMNNIEKLKIIKNAKIKKEFIIDKIAILKFSEEIVNWEIVKEFNL